MSRGAGTLYILSSDTPAEAWPAVRRAVHEEGARLYMLRYDLVRSSLPPDLSASVQPLEDLLDRAAIDDINARATAWATRWHGRASVEPLLSYGRVNIGDAVYYALFNYVNAVLRMHMLAAFVLEREQPGELRVFLSSDGPASAIDSDDASLLQRIAVAEANTRGISTRIERSGIGPRRGSALDWLRHARRSSIALRARLRRRRATGTAARVSNSAPIALFVRSSHSIIATAAAYREAAGGRAYYIGLGDDARFARERAEYPDVEFIDLYAHMPIFAPRAQKRFLQTALHELASGATSIATREEIRGAEYLHALLRDAVVDYLRREGPWVLRYAAAAQAVLRETGAGIVFADNSQQPIERLFLRIGTAVGALTVETAHSLCNDVFTLGFPEHFITDAFFVWGEHDRALMERLGAAPGALRAVGAGRLGRYFRAATRGRNQSRSIRIGVSCDKEYKYYGVTAFGCLRDRAHLERYRSLIELAREDSRVVLTFKLRAGMGQNHYLVRMLREAGIQNYEIVHDVDLPTWLTSLSMLVTDFSTMGLEAMIFDVPVLVHRSDEVGDALGYEASGAVDIIAPDMSNLSQLVYGVSADAGARSAARAEFVARAVGPRDAKYHETEAARALLEYYATTREAPALPVASATRHA